MRGEAGAIDSAGNIYVLGDDGNYHLHIIKYHSSGAIIWSRDMAITTAGTGLFAACDKIGNLYFSFEENLSTSRFNLTKYDSTGNKKWTKYFEVGGYSYPEGIALDTSGNILLTGYSELEVDYYFTIKFNTLGDTLWSASYRSNIGGGGSVPNSIFVDKPGNVYITGTSWVGQYNVDWVTIKYSNNGIRQWVTRYDGPFHLGGQANCVKADDEGYCYVTGLVGGDTNHAVFGTIKYTSYGDSVWTRLYIPHLWLVYEEGIDLIIDGNKNVYVIGGGADTNYAGALIQGAQLIKYDRNGNTLFNIIDTNAKDNPPNICEFNGNIYFPSYHGNIYTAGYNMTGNRIFYSYYPFVHVIYYSPYKLLPYRNNYLIVFGNGSDSSITIKYSSGTGIVNSNQNAVSDYKLFQNFPNPFNPVTSIKYQIPRSSNVKLIVYDILGKEIAKLVDQKQNAGSYETQFPDNQYSNNQLPSGVYFYSLFIDGVRLDTKKLILLK